MLDVIRYYRRVVGLRGLAAAIHGKLTHTPRLLRLTRPELTFPFYLRMPSSDVQAYAQIFLRQDYQFAATRPPQTIVDAGANIGLASLYFANQFPQARILALEPEASNFALLTRNCRHYSMITPIHGALWHANTSVTVVDPGGGKWGFQTRDGASGDAPGAARVHAVQGMTVDALMQTHGLTHIDILKIDIEGAEREVFRDPSAWIDQVDTVIVELHEYIHPGCAQPFYAHTTGFDAEWRQGENIYRTRRTGCVRPAP
jgi:FkbM family methyltransferase